jgi:hypothetical protein
MCPSSFWISIGDAGQGIIDELVKSLPEVARDRAALQIKPDLPQRAPVAHLLAIRREKNRIHRRHPPPQRR